MLDNHFRVDFKPQANPKNVVLWKDYRITVLGDRLFRLEKSPNKKFRDSATQSVWFRDVEPQRYSVIDNAESLQIKTEKVTLCLAKKREDCKIIIDGKTLNIDNSENLKGTYVTLDVCDGSLRYKDWTHDS